MCTSPTDPACICPASQSLAPGQVLQLHVQSVEEEWERKLQASRAETAAVLREKVGGCATGLGPGCVTPALATGAAGGGECAAMGRGRRSLLACGRLSAVVWLWSCDRGGVAGIV